MNEYKDVVGYEGLYTVSNTGLVFSSPKGTSNPRGKHMSISNDHNGYPRVVLRKNGKKYNHSVHRLVAETWIPNTDCLPQVNHINGDKNDNRVENLEWCTASYNSHHREKLGLRRKLIGEEHPNSKLTKESVQRIRESLSKGRNQNELASIFGVSQTTISHINSNLIWRH